MPVFQHPELSYLVDIYHIDVISDREQEAIWRLTGASLDEFRAAPGSATMEDYRIMLDRWQRLYREHVAYNLCHRRDGSYLIIRDFIDQLAEFVRKNDGWKAPIAR